MDAKESGDFLFISTALRDTQYELFVICLGSGDFNAVKLKKDDCGDYAYSFVAVDKRMVHSASLFSARPY